MDFSEPAVIIMLGVAMYLYRDNLCSLLSKLNKFCANAPYIVLDYYILINRMLAQYKKHLAGKFIFAK